jgi:hypothetical protein
MLLGGQKGIISSRENDPDPTKVPGKMENMMWITSEL